MIGGRILTNMKAGGVMSKTITYSCSSNSQLELLTALNELKTHYLNAVGYEGMTSEDFIRALKYFCQVVESEEQ